MPNYSKSKIYAIRSPSTDTFYIGCTTNELSKRFSQHKSKGDTGFDYEDSYIELTESVECKSKEELKAHLYNCIRKNPLCINYIPENKEKEKRRERYEKQKEVTYKCECGALVRMVGKQQHEKTQRHFFGIKCRVLIPEN